jgi:hypothetical protein
MAFHNLKGNGITDIDVDEQVGDEAVNTVTIKTDADQEGTEFQVRNGSRGNGIASSSEQLSDQDGGFNTFTFTDDDGNVHEFHSKNGTKGSQGDSAVYDPSDPDAPDFVMANTTGQSTTKAMTQKAVTDEVVVVKESPIDLSQLELHNYCMGGSNKWNNKTGSKHIYIPVVSDERYSLKCTAADSGGGFSAFLTSSSYSGGGTIPYVSGTSRAWRNVGTEVELTVPSGAEFICLTMVDDNIKAVSWNVAKLIPQPLKDEVSLLKTEVEELERHVEDSIERLEDDIASIEPSDKYMQDVSPDGFHVCDKNGHVVFRVNANGESETITPTTEGANKIVTFSKLSPIRFRGNITIDFIWDVATSTRYSIIRIFKDTLEGSTLVPRVDCVRRNYSDSYSAKELAAYKGYDLVINCGLGNLIDGDVEGVLIQDGVVMNNELPISHIGVMPLTVDGNGQLGYAAADADADTLVANGIVNAFCGFAPLVVDYVAFDGSSAYQSVPHYNDGAQRQIIGQYDNGDYALISCEGRGNANSVGWTIPQAQEICIRHGLKFAYNCDGGKSTQTVIGAKQLATWYNRKICTYLYFKF